MEQTTQKNTPRISVIMPVYNTEKYVGEAIQSILDQTFTDFEFIIINDGSSDRSAEIVQSFVEKEKVSGKNRIVFINEKENTGYVKRLNNGLAQARGQYIARMDADDVSLPRRFAKQVKYLDSHKNILVVGSSADTIDTEGVRTPGWTLSATPAETRVHFLFTNYIMHPTVMMRKSMLPKTLTGGVYDASYMPSEDFELWTRILHEGTKTGAGEARACVWSFPEPLILYRVSQTSTSNTLKPTGYINASRILKRQLEWLGMSPTDEEVEMHHQICDFITNKYSLAQIDAWFTKLWNANTKAKQSHVTRPQSYPTAILLSTIIGRRLRISKKGFIWFVTKLVGTLGPVEWLGFVFVVGKKSVRYFVSK